MEDTKRQQTSDKEALLKEVKVKLEGPLTRADSSISPLRSEKPMFGSELLEVVCHRDNLKQALKQVRQNKGAPGVDGMTVDDLGEYLKKSWPEIKAQILNGTYKPKPVRRVTIPKPNGKGSRLLGIPCVLDRFIQQALLQVIQPVWDPKFSEKSYGFRPGRSAHQAIAQAQKYLEAGYEYVVDIDLEKFFDRVNHDRLMSKLQKEIEDKRVLKLIRLYLNAGVLSGGLISPSMEGVPQGSPLSPFLSNVVLDELDKELEIREHKHVRYGDDCNIYVKSKRAGERVKESMTRFIEKRLKLKVNENKSAVDLPRRRKFLGFTFTGGIKPNRRQIAPESIARFKVRVRELTRRNWSISMEERIDRLSMYVKGWRGYFGYCETSAILKELDGWVRRRLRCVYWKQWKVFKKRRAELIKRGIMEKDAIWAAMSPRGPWVMSQIPQVRRALNNNYFDEMGLTKLVPI